MNEPKPKRKPKVDRLKEDMEYYNSVNKVITGKDGEDDAPVKMNSAFDNQFKAKMTKINKRRTKNKMARKSRSAQQRKKKGK